MHNLVMWFETIHILNYVYCTQFLSPAGKSVWWKLPINVQMHTALIPKLDFNYARRRNVLQEMLFNHFEIEKMHLNYFNQSIYVRSRNFCPKLMFLKLLKFYNFKKMHRDPMTNGILSNKRSRIRKYIKKDLVTVKSYLRMRRDSMKIRSLFLSISQVQDLSRTAVCGNVS